MKIVVEDYATKSIIEELHEGTLIRTIECGRESSVTYTFLILEGISLDLTLDVKLQGERSSVTIRGIYALGGRQHVTIRSCQEHNAPFTTSDLRINGCSTDNAQVHYSGMVFINSTAKGACAAQYATALLLSSQAQATSIPSLEVLTNDVQCSHGSAVGQLDAQQLLYLQSRGLDEQHAKKLLVHGFFVQMLADVPSDYHWNERITHKLCKEGYESQSTQ